MLRFLPRTAPRRIKIARTTIEKDRASVDRTRHFRGHGDLKAKVTKTTLMSLALLPVVFRPVPLMTTVTTWNPPIAPVPTPSHPSAPSDSVLRRWIERVMTASGARCPDAVTAHGKNDGGRTMDEMASRVYQMAEVWKVA